MTAVTKSSASDRMLKVDDIAAMLNCSTRSVYRLRDGGQLPASIKIGSLVRWQESAIRSWIAAGCKPSRN
jgi:predicted DNA-binding transcriptional regulator AlpA